MLRLMLWSQLLLGGKNQRGEDGGKYLEDGLPISTLPKTNMAPENRPLEKEIPIGNHRFQVLC